MSEGLSALFWGVVTFSLLIVIHEGGHFLAARAFGVKVHEFMIGLPGPALRIAGKKTTYGITAIPLGGYVRIAGMEPGPEDPLLEPALASVTRRGTATPADVALDLGIDEEEAARVLLILADWDALTPPARHEDSFEAKRPAERAEMPKALLDEARAKTYRALSTPKRIIVLSAGVVLNLIMAVLVFSVVVSTFGVLTNKVSEVATDSAAASAGIIAGDRIVEVAGEAVGTWDQLASAVADHDPGDTIEIVAEREGSAETFSATLGENPDTGTGLLGVSPSLEKPTPWRALTESVSYIGLTFAAVLQFFNPATAGQAVSQSASIIGASYIAADAARTSALNYAAIVAMLSLSLGVINIFPIPPLDGGKIALEIVERFRGRPLSRRLSLAISATGAVLLFSLIAFLMYSDVVKFILG